MLIQSRLIRRIVKISLITLAVLVLVALVGVWMLNRWLKSPEMHARLEKEMSLALKMPLKFKTLRLSVFGGLNAEGVTVTDRGRTFFEAGAFTAKNDFWALTRGRIVFDEIKVDAPHFFLVQRSNGDWKLPDLPPELQAELDAKKKPKQPAGETEPKAAKPAANEAKKSKDVRIGKIRITNGIIELVEQDGHPFLSAIGVAATLSDISDESVAGYTAIGRLVWHGNFAANDVRATVSRTPKVLIIEKLKAGVGGGTVSGGFSGKLDQAGPPFSANLTFDKVDLSKAAMDGDAPAPNLDGALSGTLDFKGVGDTRKTFNGKAVLTLQGGTCREIEWVNQLSDVLQYEDVDLAAFKIKDLKADIQFALDRLSFKSLVVEAPPLRLVAQGESRIDGTKLKLDAKLLAEAKFLAKRPNVEPQFGPADADGMRAVPFTLTGSFGKPKQNLIERLTGTNDKTEQAIKLGLDALSNLKDEREKQKKPAPGGRAQP